MLQRQLAVALGIDVPMFSKIELGDRRAKRKHVVILAQQLNVSEEELLSLWLADKIIDAIDNDSNVGLSALNVVHKELSSQI